MIIEAFAKYLLAADPEQPAVNVLMRWLWERLSTPAQNNVDRVIKHEVRIQRSGPVLNADNSMSDSRLTFAPNSESGARLLKSLYEYAMSYEHQKWSRWIHCVKASDFKMSRKTD